MASIQEIIILPAIIQLLLVTQLIQADGAREVKKTGSRTPSSISHSLVNFGKIDLAIFLSPDSKDLIGNAPLHQSSEVFPNLRMQSSFKRPCPCSSFSSKPQTPTTSSDLLNNILMHNELFSFREPTQSANCCEHHEETLFDDDNKSIFNFKTLAKKPNLIDIVLFKNKPDINFDDIFKDAFKALEKVPIKKEHLHIVGDKKNNNVNDFFLKPSPANFKEDLAVNVMVDNKLDSNKSNQVDDADIVVTESNNGITKDVLLL